jgi:DNA-directed RNA polymerase subunit F
MIKEMKALSLKEAESVIKEKEGGSEELEKFFKKFIKLKDKDVVGMKKDLEDLNNHKIRQVEIAKIIDFLPTDISEVNKIFIEMSLEENEIKQVIEIVKKYK